jgi:hypothetical protein
LTSSAASAPGQKIGSVEIVNTNITTKLTEDSLRAIM